MMHRIAALAGIIQSCSLYELADELPSKGQITFLCSLILLLLTCYIFYPAYASSASSLSCSDNILAGYDNSEGKESINVYFYIKCAYLSTVFVRAYAFTCYTCV